jgi:predicted MFS family arabinose efflux permease
VLGITSSVTMPARQALIRSLVPNEDMLNAVALNAMQMNASRIIWPTLAGGLLAVVGSGPTLLLCVACYFVGMGFLIPIKDARPSQISRGFSSAFTQIGEGIGYMRSVPVLSLIMTMVIVVGIFGLSFMNTGPAFGREAMHMSKSDTGLFIMASGIGSIFGSSFLLFFDVKNRHHLFMAMMAPFGGSMLLLAINPYFLPAFFFMAIFGFGNSAVPVIAQTIFQVTVPQHLLGRVVSLLQLAPGLASVMALPIGYLGDQFGLRAVVGVSAVIFLSFSAIVGGLRLPRLGPLPELAPEIEAASA